MMNHKIFAYKTLLSAILYLFWDCCFGNGGAISLFTITWSSMVQTLNIHTEAYSSRIVRGQSTLKDVIEQYFLEQIVLRMHESHESLVGLIC